jgi:glycerophosphoryl diester phosphodiesterase
LEAYRTALDMGVDLVEVDVHRLSDGTFVCTHDAPVDATGDGSPALGDVLELIAEHRAGAHVDLKEVGYEAELVAYVSSYAMHPVYYTVGDADSVRALRDAGAEALLTLGPKFSGRPVWDGLRDLVAASIPFRTIVACDARGVAAQFRLAGPVLRWWCHRRSLAVLVWTINDDRRLKHFLRARGVTAVVTDRPRRALDLRDRL